MTTLADEIERLERWPGYTEQSWAERFAELELRYRAQQALIDLMTQAALRSAEQVREKAAQVAEDAWQALKERCCISPKDATRCVMVSREDFIAAIREDRA